MKKILISVLFSILTLGIFAQSYFLPNPFAKIKKVWNTHDVPLGINQDSTWLSLAQYAINHASVGSGTQNFLPLWNNSLGTTLGNSFISQSGNNILIPNGKFLTGSTGLSQLDFNNGGDGHIFITTDGGFGSGSFLDMTSTYCNIGNGGSDIVINNTGVNIGVPLNYSGSPVTNGYFLQTDASGNATWAAIPSAGWSLTGNAGTSNTTNFIGTTDNHIMNFRVKNNKVFDLAGLSMRIADGSYLSGSDTTQNMLKFYPGGNGWLLSADGETERHGYIFGDNQSAFMGWGFNNYINIYNAGRIYMKDTVRTDIVSPNTHILGNLSVDGAGNNFTVSSGSSTLNGTVTINDGTQANGYVFTSDASGIGQWLPASVGWLLNGNAGTNPLTDFIGTTDTTDLVFKTFNTEKMRIESGGNVKIDSICSIGKPLISGFQLNVGMDNNERSGIGVYVEGTDRTGFYSEMHGDKTIGLYTSQPTTASTYSYGVYVGQSGATPKDVGLFIDSQGATSQNFGIECINSGLANGSDVFGGYFQPQSGLTNYGIYTTPRDDGYSTTQYGIFSNPTGSVVTGHSYGNYNTVTSLGHNIGGYFEATGGATNYSIIVPVTGGNAGIGTIAPDPSAILDCEATDRGFLPPQMTTTLRNGISSPKKGLIVYDTSKDSLFLYRGSWAALGGGGGGGGTVTSIATGNGITGGTITTTGTLGLSGATGDIGSFSGTNTYSAISAVASGSLFASAGTSTKPVWSASPTLTTSLTTPLLIGGTGTTSPLTFQTTTGVGTTGADFIWKSGNNGATENMRLLNNGRLGIGTASPAYLLHLNGASATGIYIENSGVTTGITDLYGVSNLTSTHAFFQQGNYSSSFGGNNLIGTSGSNSAPGYAFWGIIGGTAPTLPAILFSGSKRSGTTTAQLTSSEMLIAYENAGSSGNGAGTYINPIMGNGAMSIGTGTVPSGNFVNIAAGTTSIAPLNFNAGTNKTTAAAGNMEYDGTSLFFTNGGAQRQSLTQAQYTRVSTQFDATTNTTLAAVTGLTATVVAGKTYEFEATLHLTEDAVGGSKVSIDGTATATNIIYEVTQVDGTVTTNTAQKTAMAGAAGFVSGNTTGYITIKGTITVNAGGTLLPKFSENVSSGTSSVLVGSTFVTRQIP